MKLRISLLHVEITLIGAVALLMLVLSLYHWTHQGRRSGVLEMVAFWMLVAAATIAFLRSGS